jgi:ubiquinone/menaquinone biosynthesis C-methylase UbiE
MQPKNQKDHLDHWEQYKCPTGFQGKMVAAQMNQAHKDLTTWGLKHVKVEPEFVVLDVGCGGGKTISRLARRTFKGKAYGIDHSLDMVNYSKEVNNKLVAQNRVEILKGSIDKTNFKDAYFDLVTAIETYYFWSDLPKAFHEIRRILKTGGSLLIVNEMVKDGVFEIENAETIAKTHVHLLPLAEIKELLRSESFVSVKVFRKRKSPWNAILAQK